MRERFVYRQRAVQHAWMSGDSGEAGQHDPRKRDGFGSAECAIEPSSSGRVIRAVIVDGVEQDVGIYNPHRPDRSLRTNSSSPSSSARRLAWVISTFGTPMLCVLVRNRFR